MLPNKSKFIRLEVWDYDMACYYFFHVIFKK